MQQPNENWTEFDWEVALRESDAVAERYFRLLKRFCDLPSADSLIARHMGPDFDPLMLEMDMATEYGWSEWPEGDGDGDGSGEDGEDGEGDDGNGQEQALFYETDPVFVTLRQNALGWCNVYAAILTREARDRGLKVLFHLGRSLANLAYSIDDGSYENPASSISFAKRSLSSLNQAIGELDTLVQEHRRLHQILKTMRKHLIECVDRLVDHLTKCRAKQAGKNGSQYT